MKDISAIPYHTMSEKLVDMLCMKTQSKNRLFFRILVAYQFGKVASMMRCSIATLDRGEVPVNVYAINLAPSGEGKGHSNNIMEEAVLHKFTDNFVESTLPVISQNNLAKIALSRSIKNNTDQDEELEGVTKEFISLGKFAFSFDSGTTAAIKQMRHMLLMAGCGSMCLEIDEIGSNLLSSSDILSTYLELYDVGKVKQKLTKNTHENTRSEEIRGRTPANMMLYGTPDKVLDGSKVEEELFSFFDTGYGRRCIFSYTKQVSKMAGLTPIEVFDMLTDKTSNAYLESLATQIGALADPINFEKKLTISKDVTLLLIEYKIRCEETSAKLPSHEGIRKAEMAHRYFKALKVAGAFAFIENKSYISEDCLYSAIKLIEESGASFQGLLTRDRNYVKLAKYIADTNKELTHVDLIADLPFYKGGESQRKEMMNLAVIYGIKHNIVIKRNYDNGIEFIKGERLQKTSIDSLIVSYSQDMVCDYKSQFAPFSKLDKLVNNNTFEWVNHHLHDGYRDSEHCIPGFNTIVLDVDENVSIAHVQNLLKDYTYHIYTTKRHTDKDNRFRIILPMSHILRMEEDEYKEFMENVYEWLPFKVDDKTNQRSRKWSSNNGTQYINNTGLLINSLIFIPKTAKNEELKKLINDQQSLTNLERWFVNNTGNGNRSNNYIRYALMLVDSGMAQDHVFNAVCTLNNKLPDKMDDAEILSTIMVSVSKAINKRK